MFVTITNGMSNTINFVPMHNLTRTRASGGLLMQPMDMINLLQTISLNPRIVRAESGSIATIYWGAACVFDLLPHAMIATRLAPTESMHFKMPNVDLANFDGIGVRGATPIQSCRKLQNGFP